jgi:NAD+ diphosphatase
VLVLDAELAPVRDRMDGPHLVLESPGGANALLTELGVDPRRAILIYLGDDAGEQSYLAAAVSDRAPAEPRITPLSTSTGKAPSAGNVEQVGHVREVGAGGHRWAGLRELGERLDDTDAGLFTAAVAVTQWHLTHPQCSRCGADTVIESAGWSRRCVSCATEHYPRTDPAVIMSVIDRDERILLGRQSRWPTKRYSALAGFVEPGESLEAAVRREVFEESGVVVGAVRYAGSQPWPFPSSLMLGFAATAETTDVRVDQDELEDARWWSREALSLDLATGELLLPPRVSIARRLIEDWFGGPLTVPDL